MRAKHILLALGGLLVAIQLVPVSREDPPVAQTVTAPPEVERVLRRACFDCHSRQPRRPFYAYVAPISWLVAYDIAEGRERLDFTDWGRSAKESEEIAEAVGEGEMPLWYYSMMSADRRLSDADRTLLVDWAGGAATRGGSEGAGHEREDDD